MNQHILIEAVGPSVDGGRYPVKRVAGDVVTAYADIFRDGHDKIRAQLRWRRVAAGGGPWTEAPMIHVGNDRWEAPFVAEAPGDHVFAIAAWTDVYGSWVEELEKKVEAGLQVPSEIAEGMALIDRALARARGKDRDTLGAVWTALKTATDAPEQALEAAAAPAALALMDLYTPRDDLRATEAFTVIVDRRVAAYGAWYEMFPRSQGAVPGKGSTFREAALRLPDIQAMGFDVLYLPPIHPIGTTHRKGPNNSLVAGPEDPGCPWAIGNAAGGHTAVEPSLGTLEDFEAFVAAAAAHDLEVALDFAIQCSPDHPWVKEHPEWFYKRPDGTMKYAENPPKKYQDVYPVNFDTPDREALWTALKDVLTFWIDHGVKIFRVDNPHTKPLAFWEWVISELRCAHPDVVFLSEAFTRPKMMKALAKVGFSQSYTYFTWRNHGAELREYMEELSRSGMQEYYRPNFFANTPDILPEILQQGGRAAFKMRAVLAATLAPAYGIYSGYELCENAALPGREEYLDSEKYEVRVRDWDAPGNIKPLITQLNRIRRENPALQRLDNITFLHSDNDQILAYGKREGDNILIIAVNLDPHHPHHCSVYVPPAYVGVAPDGRYEVTDVLTDARYSWTERNYVRLDPELQPAHILRVTRA
jgi:starch synthase (maltosyl-transferring)